MFHLDDWATMKFVAFRETCSSKLYGLDDASILRRKFWLRWPSTNEENKGDKKIVSF